MLLARNLRLQVVRNRSGSTLRELIVKINDNNVNPKYSEALKKFEGRIWFNSVLEVQKVRLKKFDVLMSSVVRREAKTQQHVRAVPIVLNQLCSGVATTALNETEPEEDEVDTDEAVPMIHDLPFSRFLKVEKSNAAAADAEESKIPKDWLRDYELYDEADEEIDSTYGTPNPKVPVSTVPCGGCGALLHCKEASIPGYLPSELFTGLTKAELGTAHCQRCHFLINYNTAINVTVKPEDYINIVSTIRDKFALAVIMVDLLDFPCSIWPDIKSILGTKRPVFIVGNKVDLVPRDHPNYLEHIKNCLKQEAMRMGFEGRFIKNISLISAKTGFGIETLITKLHNEWAYKGDVYLIGCTNVGKSSLFNAFLKSDYCKSEATNLIQRATACPWPGTTLRMLKFPIYRPSAFRNYMRTCRLIDERNLRRDEEKSRHDQAIETKKIEHATLIGHIGRTFERTKDTKPDPVAYNHNTGFSGKIFTLNEKSEMYKTSKWCYDTPGVIQPDQILHLLTADEIIKTIPKEMIRARAFLMKPNLSLFLAGLGRLDYVSGPASTRVIVYASMELPVSICKTEDADEFYENFLGSEVLGVPIDSGEERLAKWPKLEAAYDEIKIDGEQKHITACDIVLSSAGWIGINLAQGLTATFKAWTPEKRGIYVRKPPLLPHGLTLRGKRVRRSLAYRVGEAFTFKAVRK